MTDDLDRFGKPRFHGHMPRKCGDHRTVGHYRAWCFDCGEWCYPASPCAGCEPAEPKLCEDCGKPIGTLVPSNEEVEVI